jgi:hypothetical protein
VWRGFRAQSRALSNFPQKQLLEIEQTRRHPQAPRQTTLYMLAAPSATRGVAFAHNHALSPISHKKTVAIM